MIIPSFEFLDLTAQLESLRSAVDHAAGFVNARGAVLATHLHDIPNYVKEVALHGVRHGTATMLATAQARSGHNLLLLPHGFPDAVPSGDHERLIEKFSSASNSMAFNTLADDIVSKLFSGP